MATNESHHPPHRSRHVGVLCRRHAKRENIGFYTDSLGGRRRNGVLGGLLGGLVRRGLAHTGLGHEPTSLTQNSFFFLKLLAPTALSLAFSAQPAFAHDPPVIAPTQLDFDAAHAPKNCNDPDRFGTILNAWVPDTVFRTDAERRLVVRIRWSATGGKRTDASLVDAQGVVLAERHKSYSVKTECDKVLWETAHDAAEILGAFEPPPPKEPVVCPIPSAPLPSEPVPDPPALPCPTCPPLKLPTPTITLSPAPYLSSIGLGAFVGTGIFSELNGGPIALLDVALSPRLPYLHVEFESSWTSQSSPSSAMRLHSIPLVSSLCWLRGNVRFCGGLATTIFYANQSPAHDELRLMLGPNFRMGTELFVHDRFSIHADIFGRYALAQRRFGTATVAPDEPTPFAGGLAVLGVWGVD